jgi:myo-inositol 2-dehydrogenase/D-chiro-inositol 1-dehydrogenase
MTADSNSPAVPPARPLRIGVVGAGLMGEQHASNVHRRGGVAVLAAVADADSDRAASVAARYSGATAYADGFELIAADDIDAVIIASPDLTHAAYAHACIHAGKPVLCEKPLATTVEDALSVVQAEAAATGGSGRRLIQLGFMREFDPAHVAVRNAVRGGTIGRPVMFRGSHLNPFQYGEATLESIVTQAMVHDFHSARFLLGREIVEVYCRWMPLRDDAPNSIRFATAMCTMDDGSIALIDVNAVATYGYEVSAEVTGELGTATTALPHHATIRLDGQCHTDVTPNWGVRFAEAYRIELDAWLDSLVSGVPIGPGAWDGYAANAVAAAAIRSALSNRPERVELGERPTP